MKKYRVSVIFVCAILTVLSGGFLAQNKPSDFIWGVAMALVWICPIVSIILGISLVDNPSGDHF